MGFSRPESAAQMMSYDVIGSPLYFGEVALAEAEWCPLLFHEAPVQPMRGCLEGKTWINFVPAPDDIL